jgi:hypothetical protein
LLSRRPWQRTNRRRDRPAVKSQAPASASRSAGARRPPLTGARDRADAAGEHHSDGGRRREGETAWLTALLMETAKNLQRAHTFATRDIDRPWKDVNDGERLMRLSIAREAIRSVRKALTRGGAECAEGERMAQVETVAPVHSVPARTVVAALGITVRTLSRYVAKSLPHTWTAGGHRRFDMGEIERWLGEQRARARRRVRRRQRRNEPSGIARDERSRKS